MKRIFQIVAKALSAYFIALPILFGYHSSEHQHHADVDHKDDLEEIQLSVDCEMCDLYHSQAALADCTAIYIPNFVATSGEQHLADRSSTSKKSLQFLRGPPIS